MAKTLTIGIAGGTGSGKTTITRRLQKRFGGSVSTLYHDNYYRARDDIPFEERKRLNYDEPAAFETDLMIEQLRRLKRGETIECPTYDFTVHNRAQKTIFIRPAPVILVEGILIFENQALCDINLSIQGGETVGLVGSTGSGKTTLISMIPRLYDVDEGRVTVDGVDVRDYSLRTLRDSVSVVLQNNLLFSGSISENLRWGDEDASDESLEAAAQAALPEGTPVTVTLDREYFTARDYDTFSLPEGFYQALRVTIGPGEGHNWWCVVFPSLCLCATTQEVETAAASAGFTPEEIAVITQGTGGVVFRWRLLELWQRLFG